MQFLNSRDGAPTEVGRGAAPFDALPPMSAAESGRRILWIVGAYRAICGAALNAFAWAAALYFVFGLVTFVWIQRDPIGIPLPRLVSSLLFGDVMCIALVMIAGGGTGGSLPILLFPQLAASVLLLGLDVWRMFEGRVTGAQPFQTGLIGFGYFATIGIAVALGRYTKASEDLAAQ